MIKASGESRGSRVSSGRYLRTTAGVFDLWQFGCGRVASHGKCRITAVFVCGPIESAAATVVVSASSGAPRAFGGLLFWGWGTASEWPQLMDQSLLTRREADGWQFAAAISLLSRLGRGLDYRWSSYQGRTGDVLASEDVEGRGRLRKAWGSCQTSVDPKIPEQVFAEYIGRHRQPGELKHLSNRWKRKKNRFPQ